MNKILPILSILILFSCDKLLQNKQMYSVEITSCLFKDGDFNRSEVTGNPLPIYMYVYENEFLIWEARLGKYRGSHNYNNSSVEDRIALISYNPEYKYRVEIRDEAIISEEKGYDKTWAKGFPFKPTLERLSVGNHGSQIGFKSVAIERMDYRPNKRLKKYDQGSIGNIKL